MRAKVIRKNPAVYPMSPIRESRAFKTASLVLEAPNAYQTLLGFFPCYTLEPLSVISGLSKARFESLI